MIVSRKRQVAPDCLLWTRLIFTKSVMCVWVCARWGKWVWYLLIVVSIARYFWLNSYCLSCMRSVATSSSNNTMLLLAKCMRQSTLWNESHLCPFQHTFGPNSLTWTRLMGKFREKCSNRSAKCEFVRSLNWISGWSMFGMVSSSASLVVQLNSGMNVTVHVFVKKEDILSI